MAGNLRTLGLVLAAAFVFSAMAASATSAATHHFDSDEPATHLTGEAKTAQEFIATPVDLQYMKCTTTSLEGTVEGGTAASLTVTPKYSSCGLFKEKEELAALFVEMNSCHYVFTGKTLENEIGKHANVELECDEAEDHIEIKATALKLSCISIPEQTVNGVRYTNKESGGVKDFEVEATMRGVTSTTTHSLACPTKSGKTETHNNGTYLGTVTVKGHNEAEAPLGISTSEGAEETHSFVTEARLESEAITSQVFGGTTGEGKGYECDELDISGELDSTTATSVALEPIYSECETFNPAGFAEIRTNECHYRFTGATSSGNPTGGEHATVHLECSEGKSIEIRVTTLKLKCTVVSAQEIEDAVRYTNVETPGGATHVRVDVTAHGIDSKTEGVCGSGTHDNGSLTGDITVTNPGGSVDISTT